MERVILNSRLGHVDPLCCRQRRCLPEVTSVRRQVRFSSSQQSTVYLHCWASFVAVVFLLRGTRLAQVADDRREDSSLFAPYRPVDRHSFLGTVPEKGCHNNGERLYGRGVCLCNKSAQKAGWASALPTSRAHTIRKQSLTGLGTVQRPPIVPHGC